MRVEAHDYCGVDVCRRVKSEGTLGEEGLGRRWLCLSDVRGSFG